MNYWFLYIISTGAIYGTPYLGRATEWTNIPSGCAVIGGLDESTASTIVKDAYAHPNYYIVQNNVLVPITNFNQLQLQDAKNAKIQEITNAYLTQLGGTFISSATGTSLVYDYSKSSQELWKELSDAIMANYIPSTSFPMNITLANGTNVVHTKLQLQQIFGEITARKLTLYQKLQNIIATNGTIMNATTLNAINSITW